MDEEEQLDQYPVTLELSIFAVDAFVEITAN